MSAIVDKEPKQESFTTVGSNTTQPKDQQLPVISKIDTNTKKKQYQPSQTTTAKDWQGLVSTKIGEKINQNRYILTTTFTAKDQSFRHGGWQSQHGAMGED